ncbi:serine/threonine-protein kinase [Striga asiatica]|uniref:non-specific serine/threonine protein kinase n=1 Tax=Striga asiatica TaxID=4170 RepID=A0A5A7P422_STRAF|nr:serine/threonine-protein kinase [Striga asiatica]
MPKMNTKITILFLFIITLFIPHLCFSSQTDTLTPNTTLRYPDSLVSSRNTFKLGFFTPENTTNRYLVVFYAFSPKTAVWVANRDQPLHDTSGSLTFSENGNLVLLDSRGQTVWSTNVTSRANTTLRILDTGNLVLREGASTLWESFSRPTDVFLPTMRIVDDPSTGRKVVVSSWKNRSDPGTGLFTAGLEARPIPQIVTWREDGRPYWRSGPLVQTLWNDGTGRWDVTWSAPQNECDMYGACGPHGSCDSRSSPVCSCLRGFEPADADEWARGNWTGGCRRRMALACSNGGEDGFLRLRFMKVPDFVELFPSRDEEDCRRRCLGNCTCVAYAYDSSIGCMFWRDSLIDVQAFDGVGADLYIRLPASVLVVAFASLCVVLVFIAWCCMVRGKGEKTRSVKRVFGSGRKYAADSTKLILKDELEKVNIEELPLFTFDTLANATDGFNENNLLGKGGFGPVYKRLSAASGQGMEEFMNEVIVISKLQHRNLVRLLGCCVERYEKMLVYEYMPNKSLDFCLFDPTHASRKVLDWKKRFSVMEGIGRGLLYLHRDSRLKIIHRDLKPSNVLLDEEWNPKISDFGMARIFGGNQDHGNTARVVGTYGYMAPEYAMEGRFSEKSDVYSYGVLMLEIINGKKNTRYYNREWSLSLIGTAWKMWNEQNGLAFVDDIIIASSDFGSDIVRCIQIALLCVQEFPVDRPTIQTVVSMLKREIVDLPVPEQPVFAEKWHGPHGPTSQSGYSVNELTLTLTLALNLSCLSLSLLLLVSTIFTCKTSFWLDNGSSRRSFLQLSHPQERKPIMIRAKNPIPLLQIAAVFFYLLLPSFSSAQRNPCDSYGVCGAFGICNSQSSPICSCLQGFYPRIRSEWDSGNWTSGCVRRVPLNCNGTADGGTVDGFLRIPRMKMSGYSDRWSGTEDQCMGRCLSNCSCLAFGFDVGIRCMFWRTGTLVDIQQFPSGSAGSDLHIRLADSELGGKKDNKKTVIIVVVVVIGIVVVSVCLFFTWKWRAKRRGQRRAGELAGAGESGSLDYTLQDAMHQVNLEELPLFKFETLAIATNYFSEANKLGKGGFGHVYRGELPNGREIAVKRLSKASGQGIQEFMNEIGLISKLQHRNLVRLLGGCIENKETMLIYEYLPNRSLDIFLFDPSRNILDWRMRFNIIEGICRGLLYLHRDSRLKIIHRDLKPSNILLDHDLNPKISDFGMARIYGTKQDHVSTVRVVGTYGYMAPEYAMEGRFSEKSDVFSLGVLIIEIITGRRNTSLLSQEGSLNLLGHVWKLWNEDNVATLVDRRIYNTKYHSEIVRCIHIGLLCTQESSKDRPSVSAVLSMLISETMELPEPKHPAFSVKSSRTESGASSSQQSQQTSSSVNNISVTMLLSTSVAHFRLLYFHSDAILILTTTPNPILVGK